MKALIALTMAFLAFTATAQNAVSYFGAKEFSVGTALIASTDDWDIGNADGGVGIEASYFHTENVGVRLSTATFNLADKAIDQAGADLVIRGPIGPSKRLAPYLFTGADRDFESHDWLGHAGVGLEYRFTKHVGAFVEARYQTDFGSIGRTIGGAGLRVAF